MCEHINATWLKELPGEMYACECGAIFDLADARNYEGVNHTMTPLEISEAIRQALSKRTEYLERIRGILFEYDQDPSC